MPTKLKRIMITCPDELFGVIDEESRGRYVAYSEVVLTILFKHYKLDPTLFLRLKGNRSPQVTTSVAEVPQDLAGQKMLNSTQVQGLLGCSRTTLWRYMSRKSNPIPFTKFGPHGRAKFVRDKVLFWIENHAH
jgi:predicted DNA-binding transcriptional regulator AlpA